MNDNIWYLKCFENQIGSFVKTGSDQPWHIGEFTPLTAFEEHKEFFKAFAAEYKTNNGKNWDKFFDQLTQRGYYWHIGNNEKMVRFILFIANPESRLRGQIIETT